MEKGSIESSPNKNKSTLVVYLVVSADQNGQFDRFERFCVPLAICYASINVKSEGGGTPGICGAFEFSQEF